MNTVSIIILVYKVEKYIKLCLLTIFKQTYQAKLIECGIVNDICPQP